MADSVYKILTDQTYELYQSFISSGFTAEQALELTKSQYAFALTNMNAEERRRKDRIASSNNLRRYRSGGDSSCQE